jgi:signal transduction histidine kinase
MASHEFASDEIETAILLSEQVFFAVESDRLQKRAQEGAALKERERLARELHDAVSQSIFSLSLYTEVGRRQASSGQMARVEESLEQVGKTVQQIMKQMQLLLYELRPNVLEQIGLLGALHQRLEAVERSAGIDVTLEVTGHFRLPSAVEEGLYRIAQEALNNALKHSSAQKTDVSVRVDGDVVTLKIVDDGFGFAALPEGDENIIGILHMRERAAALNADLAIESAPGEGTRVTVSVLVPGIGGVVNRGNGSTSDHQAVPVNEK